MTEWPGFTDVICERQLKRFLLLWLLSERLPKLVQRIPQNFREQIFPMISRGNRIPLTYFAYVICSGSYDCGCWKLESGTRSFMAPAPIDNRTDQELVAAVNAGDTGAFEVLYFRHRDWTMRLAMRFTGHHDDALDVLQETFGYFARKFPGFQLTAALTTFLYPAVRNFSIAARKKRQRSSGGDDQLPLIAEPQAASGSDRSDMEQSLGSLSDAHREILLMRFVDDMTQPEIAAALDLPLGTVKSRLHHAILAARQLPGIADGG